jgi:hypothetical protein
MNSVCCSLGWKWSLEASESGPEQVVCKQFRECCYRRVASSPRRGQQGSDIKGYPTMVVRER